MKTKPPVRSAPRPYEQKARARAAEASSRRILEAFLKRAEDQWFEDITLDALAQDAGVTVQTVVRKFGNKAGILEEAHRQMGESVHLRRVVSPGDIDGAIGVLSQDYEQVGRLVLRLLSQEERHPVLHPAIERGRQGHRDWLALVFDPSLRPLSPAARTATLDALVAATDIYVWKLVRLDMARPSAAFKRVVKRLVLGVLAGA